MANDDKSKLQLKTILTVLETDTQALADEIGEQRPVVSDIVNGKPRKAYNARRKVAQSLCHKMEGLILLPDQPKAEEAV